MAGFDRCSAERRERLVLPLVVLLGACQRQPAPGVARAAPSAAAAFPCTLFDPAELAGLVGAPVAGGEPADDGRPTCRWRIEGDDPRAITLAVLDRAAWLALAQEPDAEPLPGLGPAARVAPWLDDQRAVAPAAGGAVSVLTPRRRLSVEVLRRALARLPSAGGAARPAAGGMSELPEQIRIP